MSNATGGIVGTTSDTQWHPTVVYLFGLLVAEWIVFIVLSKYV